MSWLLNDVQEAVKVYDKLTINKEEGTVSGEFDIINPNTNEVLDTFSLLITFPKKYPSQCLPIVKEVSHKIPRIPDRHVYPDGTLCITTPIKEFLICKAGITFIQFLEDILRPFLATQMAISMGWLDSFPQGEYGHGFEGIYESYSEFFSLKESDKIVAGLQMVLNKNQRNKLCFCRSGKKLKKCHINRIYTLQGMSKSQIEVDLKYLILKAKKDKPEIQKLLTTEL